MKKILFSVFAMAAMLFATSCSQEEDFAIVADGTEVAVSFSLTQPEISTRAYSDGKTATNLTYAVYETGSQTALIYSGEEGREKVTFTNKKANLTLNLVKGKSYDILFWADADNAPYTFDPATQTITVNYEGVLSNDESRDAFFAAVEGLPIEGASQKSVTLTRPFAQLNFGATDTDAAADIDFFAAQTQVVVKSYATLDLLTGEVSNGNDITFDWAAIPTNETFPAVNEDGTPKADYLAMNYLLVNAKEIVDVEFTVRNGNDDGSYAFTNTYSNVPVQRNHRTNIYGSLLTNATDFTIEIDERYDVPNCNGNFNGIHIGEKSYQTIDEALTEAVNGDIIYLGAGVYELSRAAQGKTLSFVGTGCPHFTTIKVNYGGNSFDGGCDYSLDGSTVTFENLTLEPTPDNVGGKPGFARCHGTYKNCVINGVYTTYSDGALDKFVHKFENCTFNVTGNNYNLWTWGANASFEKCTFNCDGKAVLVYYQGECESTVTFNDCTFNDSNKDSDVSGKAAIEIADDYSLCVYTININGCTVNGFDKTTVSSLTHGGDDLGTNVWGNKNLMTAKNLAVNIDGNEVY